MHHHTLVVCSLLSGASALCAQPLPLHDFSPLPGDTAIAPADNSQQDHSIARGADQFLVVWSDYRSQSVGGSSSQSQGDIFGIRLDADGHPVDAVPFVINAAMGEQRRPIVAWNGDSWLVVFISQDPVGGYFADQLRAVRVSASGQVLDQTPILFPPTQFEPSTLGLQVAGLNGQWLVTRCIYHSDGYGTYLAGQRISGAGVLLDSSPVVLSDWIYGQTRTIVGANEYLVVGPDWNDAAVFKARRVSAAGTPVGAAFNVRSMAIAASANEYYVAWISNFTTLVGSRMTPTGTLLTPSGTPIVQNFSQYNEWSVAHDGTQWWVEWSAADQLHTVRVSANGTVLDPGGGVLLPIVIGGNINFAYSPQLVGRPQGGVLVAWYDSRAALGSDTNVFTMPVSSENVPGAESCASTSVSNQRVPDLAAGPSGRSAVVYIGEHANDDRVLLTFLGPTGAPISPEPVQVARAATIGKAAVAWNGSVYLVVWDEGAPGLTPTAIKARRVGADGSLIDPEPLAVMPGHAPDVEALADDFLIGGSKPAANPQFIDAYHRRLRGSTAEFLEPAPVLNGTGYVSGVRVRSDGSRWIMMYQSNWTHDSPNVDARMSFISAGGAHTPANNPTPFSGSTGTPDIAFSGSRYLIVWRSNTLANANNYISGRLMNADGSFATGAFTIAEAPGRQLSPVASWDGSTFIVAWEDQRNQLSFFDQRTDIYAARVTTSGQVLDNPAFPVVRTAPGDASPALLPANGTTLIASARFTNAAPYDAYRVGITRLGNPPCTADFNHTGNVDSQDFFDFLGAFFALSPSADVNGDGAVNSQDFFDFLGAFFAGC